MIFTPALQQKVINLCGGGGGGGDWPINPWSLLKAGVINIIWLIKAGSQINAWGKAAVLVINSTQTRAAGKMPKRSR